MAEIKSDRFRGKKLMMNDTIYIMDTLYEDKDGKPLTLVAEDTEQPDPGKKWVVFDARGWAFKAGAAI
jgi:hypothetical protein